MTRTRTQEKWNNYEVVSVEGAGGEARSVYLMSRCEYRHIWSRKGKRLTVAVTWLYTRRRSRSCTKYVLK